MSMINPGQSVIVFDLDDTLYAEYEYKVSGIRAVIRSITQLYPQWTVSELENCLDPHSSAWLDDLCRYCGFNESEQQALLWQYRLHEPTLTPYLSAASLAELTRGFSAKALITDGRSITQRLKLKALGLADFFDNVLISEAYRSEKPCDKRFVFLQNQYSSTNNQFIYIGDNIKKDFVTPNRLGWLTIGLKASEHNIHIHHPDDFDAAYHPQYWIDSLTDLSEFLSKIN